MRAVEKQYMIDKLDLHVTYAQEQRVRCEHEGNVTEAKLYEGRESAYKHCLRLLEDACALPDSAQETPEVEIPEQDTSLEIYLNQLSDADRSGDSDKQPS